MYIILIINYLLYSLLIANIKTKCLQYQVLGYCSRCQPIEILFNGNCFIKIRGCLKQVNDKCLECQYGYVGNNNICTRQAIANNYTSTQIPPGKIEIQPELTPQDINKQKSPKKQLIMITQSSLLSLLKNYDRKLFSNTYLLEYLNNNNSIEIKILTNNGIYSIQINTYQPLYILKLSKISDNICIELNQIQINKDNKFNVIISIYQKSLLLSYYRKKVQIFLKDQSIIYHILYSTSNRKKRSIFLSISYEGQIKILKDQYLGNGYEIVGKQDPIYDTVLSQSKQKYSQELIYNNIGLFRKNKTNYQIFYITPNVVYQYTSDKYFSKQSLKLILKIPSNIKLPQGFNWNYLVQYNQIKDSNQYQLVDKQISSKYTYYLSNKIIRLISLQKFNQYLQYNILYETNFGYFQALVKYNLFKKSISIVNFIFIILDKSSYDICYNLQFVGYCPKCKQNQIYSFGQCYQNIDNCFVQVGEKCLICQDDTFQSQGNSCQLQCSNFINSI